MATTRPHCDDHVRHERELGEASVARISLEKQDTATAKAVDKLDARLAKVEKRIYLFWGASIAFAMGFPLILKLLGSVIPAARAAVGG